MKKDASSGRAPPQMIPANTVAKLTFFSMLFFCVFPHAAKSVVFFLLLFLVGDSPEIP